MKRAEMAKRGKSGELLVAGELLSQGYDVFIPFVDCGIDLVALVENRFVQLQVKQSKLHQRKGKPTHYWQGLKKKVFNQNKGKDIFYVFVLKRGTDTNYLIFPSLWIDKNADKFDIDKNEKWQFYFTSIKGGKIREVRKSMLDVTSFLNNWDILKQNKPQTQS